MTQVTEATEARDGNNMGGDQASAQSDQDPGDLQTESAGGMAALRLILTSVALAAQRDNCVLLMFSQGLAMGLAMHEIDSEVARGVYGALHLSPHEHDLLRQALEAAHKRYHTPTE